MEARKLQMWLSQIQYPGMPGPESNITRAWVRAHGGEYDTLSFNFRVGLGQDLQPGITGATAAQVAANTRKRIDIVARSGGVVDLIEVKTRMTLGTLGQLLGYRHLWQDDFPQVPVRRSIALAQIIDPDIARVLALNGITYFQLEPEVI